MISKMTKLFVENYLYLAYVLGDICLERVNFLLYTTILHECLNIQLISQVLTFEFFGIDVEKF